MATEILYISYDGMTDPLGQSQVLPYLTGLSKKGYRFTLISCEKPTLFKEKRSTIEKVCSEASIDWHPISYTKWPPILSTLYDLLRIILLTRSLLRKKPVSIIHCRSYIAAMAGLYFKKRKDVKFIFDMRGFWADERIDGGIWPKDHWLYGAVYRFFKKKEIQFLEAADSIITLTQKAKEEIETWDVQRSAPITVIPCCADLAHFDYHTITAQQTAELKRKYSISPEALVIGYLGSLGTWYMLDEMLQLFKVIVSENPLAVFFVVSNDPAEKLSQLVAQHDIPAGKVIITGSKRETVPLYLSAFDIGFFFILPTFSKKASSPVKHGEMMGMGIPLICNKGVGDVDAIVTGSQSGYIVEDFTASSLQKACDKMIAVRNIPREHIRSEAFKYYDLELGISKYHDIYTRLAS